MSKASQAAWSVQTHPDVVRRRAAGRRHYHAMMRLRQLERRLKVSKLLIQFPPVHGRQAHIARLLGVSEPTISRDVHHLRQAGRRTSE
jgi:hypothetical protein